MGIVTLMELYGSIDAFELSLLDHPPIIRRVLQ